MLAGGQSLVPLLSMRLAAPDAAGRHQRAAGPGRIIEVERTDGVRSAPWPGTPTCSPTTRPPARSRCWRMALRHVAHPTIRNRGTTVGSLVHADAAAEMPAVLCLLDGSVEAGPVPRAAHVPADELYLGPLESLAARTTSWRLSAFFPAPAPGRGGGVRGGRPPARRLRALRGRGARAP